MKKLIYLLFCYICAHSYCTEQKDRLTGILFIIFNNSPSISWCKIYNKIAAPTYGIAEVTIPGHRVKRDDDQLWSFPVKFSDGKEIQLNFKLTDGILIDSDTPVWFARGRGFGDDRIDYRPSNDVRLQICRYPWNTVQKSISLQFLRGLGKFSIYQDFENKAAIVVFHKHKIIVSIPTFQCYFAFVSHL